MKARSNQPYSIRAFSGREYVDYEWRPVPDGLEEEARGNPYLDLLEDDLEIVEDVTPPPVTDDVIPPPVDDAPPAVNATDAAVALALEHGLDLSAVVGTGTDGRITKPDVMALIEEEE